MPIAMAVGLQSFGVLFATFVCSIDGAVRKETMSVELQAATMEYVNPEYLDTSAFVKVSRKARNRSPVFNAVFPFIKDLPQETGVRYLLFQKMRNAWRPTLIKGTVIFCSMLDSNVQIHKAVYQKSNFPHKCPVKKGNYTFRDVSVQEGDFPPVLPAAELKVKSTWMVPSSNLMSYFVEFKVVKRGATGVQAAGASTVLAVNQTLG